MLRGVNSTQRIALTGGPCAGKTTILAQLTNVLENRGFGVLNIPEAATMMSTAGISLNASMCSNEF
jgi:nucleoside-triphosphatase THEP1